MDNHKKILHIPYQKKKKNKLLRENGGLEMKKFVVEFYKLQLLRGYIALEQPYRSSSYIAFEHSQHLSNYIYCLSDHNTQAVLPMLKVVLVLEAFQVSFPTPKVISSASGSSNDLFRVFRVFKVIFCIL